MNSGHEYTQSLLSLIRFEARVYHNAKVCGNWLLREHAPGQTCFHMVTTGSCRVEVPGILSTSLNNGDLLYFTRELPHTMAPLEPGEGPLRHLPYSAADPGTGLLCAEVVSRDRISEYLLQSLPGVLLIRNEPDAAWLPPLLELIVLEGSARHYFGTGITDRLCELLFSYALSHYLNRNPKQGNLLALYTHPRLAAVVAAIHAQPERAWSLSDMAQLAAQSRTLFCKVFRETCGWTPMHYLLWWRMQLAFNRLQMGEPLAEVAAACGYGSTAAFSRAFKAFYGENAGTVGKAGRIQAARQQG